MTVRKNKGFTLIELLIVIAILGTLAVVVLLALNPVQQLARTRDAGRISSVAQIGHALEAYSTTNGGNFPAATAAWATVLRDSGELAALPSAVGYSAGTTGSKPPPANCTTNVVVGTGWCYAMTVGTPNRAIVYTRLESGAQNGRCAGNNVAWAVYSTANGRGGVLCTAGGEPTVPAAGGYALPSGLTFPTTAVNTYLD